VVVLKCLKQVREVVFRTVFTEPELCKSITANRLEDDNTVVATCSESIRVVCGSPESDRFFCDFHPFVLSHSLFSRLVPEAMQGHTPPCHATSSCQYLYLAADQHLPQRSPPARRYTTNTTTSSSFVQVSEERMKGEKSEGNKKKYAKRHLRIFIIISN